MPSSLALAVADAALETSASVAQSTGRPADEVRRQMDDVVRWIAAGRLPNDRRPDDPLPDGDPAPAGAMPIINREYLDLLRAGILTRVTRGEAVDAKALVRVLNGIEELSQAWKRTDRGRFITRLMGADSADAIVAVAHDLRSPLTSILILVDSLRRGRYGPGDPARDRQLGIIYGAAQGLCTLASDLIDAARGERLSIGPATAFSVTETMSSIAQILEPVSEERAVPLRLNLPEVDGRIGHPAALHRVLLNLASNALRCTERGFVAISCTELTSTVVEFAVTDTGPGIPAEVLQRLFEGFSNDRLSLRFSRTGLGLAIVRTLIDAMGSHLDVETAPGRGARFFFQLDLAHAR